MVAALPSPPHVSVVMPVFNEAATIGKVARVVLARPEVTELVVVDDASSDGTWGELQRLASGHPDRVRLLRHERNMGKGAALKTGFAAATGDIVLVQDADLEYDPGDYSRLLEPILRDAAEKGTAAAAELGAMYYFGSSDLAQDYVQALPLLRQAAEGGDADSANTLGVMYDYGQGIEEDKKQAAKFYRQAAQAGHVKAQASLGMAYAKGHGVERDPVQGFYWFRLSGRQNEAMGQNALADYIRGLSEDQIPEGHRKVAEFLRARGEEVTAAQLDEEIFNPKMPTLEEMMPEATQPPAVSPTPTPDDQA